jgi:hypothetical protein
VALGNKGKPTRREEYVDELELEEPTDVTITTDPLRSATPVSATILRDKSGQAEMVYDVELPALNMGLVFREGPKNSNVAVVDQVLPESPAFETRCVEPGDVLVRCSATVFAGDDLDPEDATKIVRKKPALVTVGGPWIGTRHETVSFECLGEPFEKQMAAVKSTGIIDAGFAKRKIRLEFMRAIDEKNVSKEFGHLDPAGHPATQKDYDPRAYPPAE